MARSYLITSRELNKIKALHKQGMPVRDIVKETNRSKTAIYKILDITKSQAKQKKPENKVAYLEKRVDTLERIVTKLIEPKKKPFWKLW